MSRATLVAAAAAAVALVPAGTAVAHVEKTASSPRSGATVSASLRTVTVTFSAVIRSGTLRVTGPGGKVVSRGGGRDPRRASRLRAELRGPLKPGSYRATWTIRASDGHSQKGSFRFRVRSSR